MRKITTALGLIIATLLLLGGCSQVAPPPEGYEQVKFNLVSDTTPGNTDEYASYIFYIPMESEQKLSLYFYATGGSVMFTVVTPSDASLGYVKDTSSADANAGYLKSRETQAATEGHFIYNAPEGGDYMITVRSTSPKAETDVVVNYKIE